MKFALGVLTGLGLAWLIGYMLGDLGDILELEAARERPNVDRVMRQSTDVR